jgi:hypothetical protein
MQLYVGLLRLRHIVIVIADIRGYPNDNLDIRKLSALA